MATTQQLYDEATAAYHRLMLGESVVEVRDQSGESIRYQAASADRLKKYIEELYTLLNGVSVSQPMRFVG